MNENLQKRLQNLRNRDKANEQETVRINFELGELHSEFVTLSGLSGRDAGQQLGEFSGIGARVFETNGRIARRIDPLNRPNDLPWSAIKYLAVDLSPKKLGAGSETDFCSALSSAIAEIDGTGTTNIELKKKPSGATETVGVALMLKHLKMHVD